MAMEITPRLLEGAARTSAANLSPVEALRWVEKFGGAAPWLLKATVLKIAAEDRGVSGYKKRWLRSVGSLPTDFGVVTPIFVLRADELGVSNEILKASVLREAFFLPLKWEKGEGKDDPHLPKGLADLAGEVRNQLEVRDWGLRLHIEGIDLSSLNLSCQSAWGALASGLILAEEGGKPKGDVAVSVAWQEGTGVEGVTGVREKALVAQEFGCRLFFVPPAQAEELKRDGLNLEVRELSSKVGDKPREVLQELLHELQVAPKREVDPLEIRLSYANGFWRKGRRKEREEYILKEITDDLACELKEKHPLPEELKGVDRAVIVASSPSAAKLSARLLCPKRLLVIYTDDYLEKYGEDPSKHLAGIEGLENLVCKKVNPYSFEEIASVTRDFVGEGERCVVDVTGGTKGMTAAATMGGMGKNATIVFLGSENPGLGGHRVGTERMMVVRS